jgi:hypothetical protein
VLLVSVIVAVLRIRRVYFFSLVVVFSRFVLFLMAWLTLLTLLALLIFIVT